MIKKPLVGTAIIGQSGGPSAVINASAYGVIKTALASEYITTVYGAYHGIVGVLNDRLMIMDKERFRPKRFEIGISGELSDETPQSESTFKSFHVVYNIECDTEDDQAKVSRAVTLAHEKYCGMMQMLRKVAPVSHEIAVVSTEPAKA